METTESQAQMASFTGAATWAVGGGLGAASESVLLLQLLAVRNAVALVEHALVVVLHHVESTSRFRGGGVLTEGAVVVEARGTLGSV